MGTLSQCLNHRQWEQSGLSACRDGLAGWAGCRQGWGAGGGRCGAGRVEQGAGGVGRSRWGGLARCRQG